MSTFSIVTTCKNPGGLLIDTVGSVLGQRVLSSGRASLEYVIVDGGSTDGTHDYLATLKDQRVRWISEPDNGMYDGLVKGFQELTARIHAYLNAGDLYHPNAFDVVLDLIPSPFEWLTGIDITHNQRGDVWGRGYRSSTDATGSCPASTTASSSHSFSKSPTSGLRP